MKDQNKTLERRMGRLKFYLLSCPDKCHGYIEDIDELLNEVESLKEQNKKLMGNTQGEE